MTLCVIEISTSVQCGFLVLVLKSLNSFYMSLSRRMITFKMIFLALFLAQKSELTLLLNRELVCGPAIGIWAAGSSLFACITNYDKKEIVGLKRAFLLLLQYLIFDG